MMRVCNIGETDTYVNGTKVQERETWSKKQGSRREKTKTEREEKWGKDKNQHNSFPLISTVYNIKAITGCLCQRVWNNTLVSGREMRRGRKKRRRGGRVSGCSSPSAGTKACCCSNKYQGYWHQQQGNRPFLLYVVFLSQPHWYQH